MYGCKPLDKQNFIELGMELIDQQPAAYKQDLKEKLHPDFQMFDRL